MTHSKQAIEVIQACDFPEECYPWLEKICCKFTPKQIIGLVWSKDKNGEHEWDWFAPFFNNGYVPVIKEQTYVNFDRIWDAYKIVCDFVEPFPVEHLVLIEEMSWDTFRLKEAISKSKPNLKYVYRVWQGLEVTKIVAINNADMVDIKKHKVITNEFN